ncbi:MAG: relaxase/mobilization nuclease domain-containing protein, partial [Waterburya sp.]
MIGNISTGKSFHQLTKYLLKPEQKAKVLHNSTIYDTVKEIASEFSYVAQKRPTTAKPVKHIAIAFAPSDGEIDFWTKYDIASAVVEQMGYTNNQWLAVEHGRNVEHHQKAHDHDHLHIMINMIGYDGVRTRDGWEKRRLEKILRNLELQYNLQPVKSSRHRNSRQPSKGQYQKFQREYDNWQQQLESNPKATPPEVPEIQTLEAIVSAAVADKPTMTTYLARLQQLGYPVEKYTTDKG